MIRKLYYYMMFFIKIFIILLIICNYTFASLNTQVKDNNGNQFRIFNNKIQELSNGSNNWTYLNSPIDNFIPKGLIMSNNNLNVIIKPYPFIDHETNKFSYYLLLYQKNNDNLIPLKPFKIENEGISFSLKDMHNCIYNQENYIEIITKAPSSFYIDDIIYYYNIVKNSWENDINCNNIN